MIKVISHRDDVHRHTWEGAQGGRQAFPFATSSRKVYDRLGVNSDERKQLSAVLLPLCLALSALPAGAADESLVAGGSGVAEDITGGVYDTLACATASVPAASAGASWNCAATCSAEINHESGTGTGQLAITDNGAVVAASERTFEINDNAGINDLSPLVIATTARTTMSTSSDPDTFCCAAKEGSGNFDAGDSSITVVCTDLP